MVREKEEGKEYWVFVKVVCGWFVESETDEGGMYLGVAKRVVRWRMLVL